jgi:hypothetical protein
MLLICHRFEYQVLQSVFERFAGQLLVNGSAINGIEKLLKKAVYLLNLARCPIGHDRFPFAVVLITVAASRTIASDEGGRIIRGRFCATCLVGGPPCLLR